MSVKRKLKELNNWLLLSTAGETLMLLALIIFCLAVAGMALIMGMKFDDFQQSKPQDKPKIDGPAAFEVIRL